MLNAPVCTSGITTGQLCRHFVTDQDCLCRIDGGAGTITIKHITIVKHDENLDGSFDCDTAQPGDSGGAVYQGLGERPGFVRAMGIVSARVGCSLWYSRLSGLKAWNSSVTLPTQ